MDYAEAELRIFSYMVERLDIPLTPYDGGFLIDALWYARKYNKKAFYGFMYSSAVAEQDFQDIIASFLGYGYV